MTATINKWDVLDSPEVNWDAHVLQEKVVSSAARFRCISAGRRWGKSQVGGHELLPEAFLTYSQKESLLSANKRREFWICGPAYCVDDQTEILTIDGWRSQWQLNGDEICLTQNPETGLAAWQQMTGVNVFHGERDVYESEFRGHSSVTTGEHRWLVQWGKPNVPYSSNEGVGRHNDPSLRGKTRSGWRFVTTENLRKKNEWVYCAAPVVNLPNVAKYEDAFVELVAWYWTEGQEWGHGIAISQNAGPNFDRIRAACHSLIGDPCDSMRTGSAKATREQWRIIERKGPQDNQKGVAINSIAAAAFKEVCEGFDKIVRPDFIAALTQSQLELFIKVSILADADSDWEWGVDVEIGQKIEARIDSLQMACQLAGFRTQKFLTTNPYGPWHILSIYVKKKFWAPTYAKNLIKRKHKGVVWCPTTPNGSWLARRAGSVFFTGNSDSEKEFRVIYNLMKKLDMPFDRPGTYYDAVGGSMHISAFEGTFQVHAKSAQHPDSLVGEGLSGVIMAEAAKLKERVWTKAIRPTLADFKGWALFSSTPEGKNWYYDLYRAGQDPNNPDWESWRCPSWGNPHVYRTTTLTRDVKKLQAMLENPKVNLNALQLVKKFNLKVDSEIVSLIMDLTPESFNQEIGAEFTDFVGRVFKRFDEETHVGDFEFDPSWETYAGVDYGFTNPNVWLLIQVSTWGRVRIIDELYQAGLTDEEFAKLIRDRGLCPPGIKTFYPDPASPGATRQLEEILKVKATGGTGGERKYRIDRIRQALKPRPFELPAGHPEKIPELMINRRCVNTIRDFNDYRYPEDKSQRGDNPAEEPMKKDDHAPEALGRFFAGKFLTPDKAAARTRTRSGYTKNNNSKLWTPAR